MLNILLLLWLNEPNKKYLDLSYFNWVLFTTCGVISYMVNNTCGKLKMCQIARMNYRHTVFSTCVKYHMRFLTHDQMICLSHALLSLPCGSYHFTALIIRALLFTIVPSIITLCIWPQICMPN